MMKIRSRLTARWISRIRWVISRILLEGWVFTLWAAGGGWVTSDGMDRRHPEKG